MPKVLRRTQFGNPVLRTKTRRLSRAEILSEPTQQLVANMRYTLQQKRYGVGLAAPQVGKAVALTVIVVRSTPSRTAVEPFELVAINPRVVKTYGQKEPMWEGCLSLGGTQNFPYALVPRYKKVRVQYYDAAATKHEADFEGLAAHVLQHEIDHLDGVLFVDRVEDTTSYMTIAEYKKRMLQQKR
jgi:peptide deformylase